MRLRLKIILNPSSGRETARSKIDDILAYLSGQQALERADIFYTASRFDATNYAMDTNPDDYDLILAAGGDGTVNEVITGMMRKGIDLPLAICTSGTMNDFAATTSQPKEPAEFARMLMNRSMIKVDCGKTGDMYFLNVLAGGLLTDVPYKAPLDLKTVFGPAAYWMAAMKDLPMAGNTINIHLESKEFEGDTECVLFLVSNSSSVGGFRNLMANADIRDGLLDVLILKRITDASEAISLIGKMVMQDHLASDNVIYFQTDKIRISSADGKPAVLDVDGEEGPSLPVTIECIKDAINLIVPGEE
ncbi:MAG: diacylglycerol kinase family lipid kinase [Clostridiales bacterium]|nr:diacylglycerol kinase family lipid kinase [Clostridiales bacterium]